MTGVWTIGSLNPNATATLGIAAQVNVVDAVGQSITNTATATEDASLMNPDTAQATASAALTVAGTPTSTLPRPIVPATLSVDSNGNFLARGMVVTSVASTSFQAEIWGITYTVNWTDNDGDEFLFQGNDTPFNFGLHGNRFSDEIAVGDTVNVSGKVNTSAPLTVNANVVRNDSITFARPPRPFSPVIFNGYNDRQVGSGTSFNGNGNVSSSGGDANVGFQSQLNGLTAELKSLEQMFQGRFGQNP